MSRETVPGGVFDGEECRAERSLVSFRALAWPFIWGWLAFFSSMPALLLSERVPMGSIHLATELLFAIGFVVVGFFAFCGAGKTIDILIWPREIEPRPPMLRAVVAALLDLSVPLVFYEIAAHLNIVAS